MTAISDEAIWESPSWNSDRSPCNHCRRKNRWGDISAAPLTTDYWQLVLRSFRPARQILFLLQRQPVDLDAHRLQLQLGHALVQFFRNREDLLFQRGVVFDQVFNRERLIGEAHIHHGRRMSFGGWQGGAGAVPQE